MRAARRKTLSGVDASQLNARAQTGVLPGAGGEEMQMALGKSAGVHAGAAAASRPQSRAHQHQHPSKPSNPQRRHSVYFSNGQAPRVDPRCVRAAGSPTCYASCE